MSSQPILIPPALLERIRRPPPKDPPPLSPEDIEDMIFRA